MIEQLHSGNKFGMRKSGNKILICEYLGFITQKFPNLWYIKYMPEGHLQFKLVMFVCTRVGVAFRV